MTEEGKKSWWKRRPGRNAFLSWIPSGVIGFFWYLERWVGLAGLPDDAQTLFRGAVAVIVMISPMQYGMILGAAIMLGVGASAIYVTEKWDSIRSSMLYLRLLRWAWHYVRITAIGKVSVYYRFVVKEGARGRQSNSVKRIKKGQATNIRFDIPQDVHVFHLAIEVPPLYKLLFPSSSRSDGEWVETIASNGHRRYKSAFVKRRRNSSEWVQIELVNRWGEAGWGAVRETLRNNPSVRSLTHRWRCVSMIEPPPLTLDEAISLAQEQAQQQE